MSNGQLSEAGRNGDSTLGIRALLAEHEASLLRYALRLTGDAHQALLHPLIPIVSVPDISASESFSVPVMTARHSSSC